jgi:hypothetical protein
MVAGKSVANSTLIPRLPGHYGVLGVGLLYLALSLYQINLPGLHYDEAFEALPALQLLRGQPVTTFRNSGLLINRQLYPLMTQDYIGALNTYGALPFIALFGPTPVALRLMSILVGLLTLNLTYLVTRHLARNQWAGLAAALLLAVDPTFIFWNRQGIFVTAITAGIGLAATLCWLYRLEGGGRRWSVAGAFLLGLGLYAKLLFLWLIVALLGTVILLRLPGWLKDSAFTHLKQRPSKNWLGEILWIGAAFCVGCWPLLVYNLQTGGTFLSVTQNAATSFYGVNNLAIGPNLAERLNQFVVLLNGSHLWYLGKTITNPIPAVAMAISLICTLITVFGASPHFEKKGFSASQTALLPLLVIVLLILASIGTVSALWITHFAVLMPWPAIALALSGWLVTGGRSHRLRLKSPLLRGLLWVGLGLVVVTNWVSVVRYHIALGQSGGLSSHSDAIYDLSAWLVARPPGPVVAMDWGLAAPVTYLTNGQVTPTEVFGYVWQPDQALTGRLNDFISQPATLYLWRAPDEIIFDRSPEFKALYRPQNLEETIEAAFYEQSGRPLLGVTRLVLKGTAENPPQ